MKIKVIDTIAGFEAVRESWDYIFQCDTVATIFQSWSWLRGWFDVTENDWFILSICTDDESQFIAFLALSRESTTGLLGMKTYHTMRMAGEPVIDYTGMVCLPQYEDVVIEHLVTVLQNEMQWVKIIAKNLYDPRVIKIMNLFQSKKYFLQYMDDTACPRLLLPDNWEKYLEEVLQQKFSKKFKYTLRRADKEGCYIVKAETDTIDSAINCYIELHEMRWNIRDEKLRLFYKSTFKYLFDADLLQIHTLFYQKDAIGVLVAFTDRTKKIYHFYNGGWNSEYAKLSPGNVLLGHTIKHAIENGYRVYDFMRGDEPYKYLFGCENEYTKNIVLSRNTFEKKLRTMKNRITRYATTS